MATNWAIVSTVPGAGCRASPAILGGHPAIAAQVRSKPTRPCKATATQCAHLRVAWGRARPTRPTERAASCMLAALWAGFELRLAERLSLVARLGSTGRRAPMRADRPCLPRCPDPRANGTRVCCQVHREICKNAIVSLPGVDNWRAGPRLCLRSDTQSGRTTRRASSSCSAHLGGHKPALARVKQALMCNKTACTQRHGSVTPGSGSSGGRECMHLPHCSSAR